MPVHNADVASIFEEIADLLEIKGDNPFRVRAYRNAALTIEGLGKDLAAFLKDGQDLKSLPGIGKDLEAKILEILASGTCRTLEALHRQVPATLRAFLKIPGLGPKRVAAIYRQLGIETSEDLMKAAEDGRLHALPGLGLKTEQRILEALRSLTGAKRRFLLGTATQYALPLAAYLEHTPGVQAVVIAGSYRRRRETVGDLDLLVTADEGSPVMERFSAYDEAREIVSLGETRATLILRSNLQVDVRLVPPQSFGAALQYFTGSKAHNIVVRRQAVRQGLKINEYGVFDKEGAQVAGQTENSVYKTLGLPYIPPELREDRGEIEAARAGLLPELIESGDLKGDLHIHTSASDGHNDIREMALAARAKGFEYIAVTEHSRRLRIARGLDVRRLLRQCEEIDQLNETLAGITVLKGIEVDILEDGRLDLPDEVLAKLDLVIGAVHSQFRLARDKQTRRILRAMDHPHFSMLAHPGGRLINERAPCEVDMLRIIRKARQRCCFLELNANPRRLDLQDVYCQTAREEGVLVSINSDAHSVTDFDNLEFGIGQARRGWLSKKDVLNTRPLKELAGLLKQTM